jgi:sarcosine oxidase
LLLRSYELWERLVRDSGDDLMTLCGGLFPRGPDTATVAGSLLASRAWDLPHELLDAAGRPSALPDGRACPTVRSGCSRLRPGWCARTTPSGPTCGWRSGPAPTSASASRCCRGRRRRPGARHDGRRHVRRGAARRRAGRLGTAAARRPGRADHVERQITYWFQPAGGTAPYVGHPIWIHDDGAGTQAYGFPALDGPLGGVKTAFFRGGAECTPETIDREVHDSEVEAVRRHVARLLPGATDRFLRAVTCMYSNTPDHHFVVARHPGYERVTVACGFSGHGFKFVPVIGEVLADLATTGTTEHPVELFDPRRPSVTGAQVTA